MKIAIDVESVLAEPTEAVLQSTDTLTYEQVRGKWLSTSDEDSRAYQIYMGVSDAIWRHKPEVIPPEESNLDEYVAAMRENHEVHILTSRQHVDAQVQWWLERHNIEYDGFISTGRPKYEFDEFDIFIDDNPDMAGHCRLFLRHQPWNEHIDVLSMKGVTRIYSVAEVLEYL